MEYFVLTHQIDTKDTGPVDQQVVWKNPNNILPNPLFDINDARDGIFPKDDLFPFSYLEVNKRAKLSDLMSSPFYNGFVVSNRFRKIIEASNIIDYRFYDIILLDGTREILDYSYFHLASCLRNHIDYRKSSFYIGTMLGEKIRNITTPISDYNSLIEVRKSLTMGFDLLYAERFYLSDSFPFNIDVFRLCCFNYEFFISGRFKSLIENTGMTGVSIISAKDFIKTPSLA